MSSFHYESDGNCFSVVYSHEEDTLTFGKAIGHCHEGLEILSIRIHRRCLFYRPNRASCYQYVFHSGFGRDDRPWQHPCHLFVARYYLLHLLVALEGGQNQVLQLLCLEAEKERHDESLARDCKSDWSDPI